MGVNKSFTPIFFVYSIEIYRNTNFHINHLWKL
nr:MAG TPA: hypothetical protein [Caudoviricetes sp.]